MPPEFLTLDDVAERFNVSRETIDRLVARGELASVKFGTAQSAPRRIPASAVDEFIARRLEGSPRRSS